MTPDPLGHATNLAPGLAATAESSEARRLPGGARASHLARRLFSLPARDFFEFLGAHGQLLRARLMLATRPKGSLLQTVTHAQAVGDARGEKTLARLVLALNRAAEYGFFRPTCLVRAVALERMLHRSGLAGGVVRVGVRPAGHTLLAHAWIERDGRVVGDDAGRVRQFTPLSDFTALPK